MTPCNVVLFVAAAAVLFAQIMHISSKPRKQRCVSLLASSSSRKPEPKAESESETTSSPRPIPKLPFDLYPKPSPPSVRNATAFSTKKSPSSVNKPPPPSLVPKSTAAAADPKPPSSSPAPGKLSPESLHHLFKFPLQLISSLLLTLIPPLQPTTYQNATSSIGSPSISLLQTPCYSSSHSTTSRLRKPSLCGNTNDSPPAVSCDDPFPADHHSPVSDDLLSDNTNNSPVSCNPAPPGDTINASPVPCDSRPGTAIALQPMQLPAGNANNSPTPCNSRLPQHSRISTSGSPAPCNLPPGSASDSPAVPRRPCAALQQSAGYSAHDVLVYNLLCNLLSHEAGSKSKPNNNIPPPAVNVPESASNDYYYTPSSAGNTLVDGVAVPTTPSSVLPCLFAPSRKNAKTSPTQTHHHRALKPTRVQPLSPPTPYDHNSTPPAAAVSPYSQLLQLFYPPKPHGLYFANSTNIIRAPSFNDGLSPQEVLILKILRSLNSTSNTPSSLYTIR